MAAPLGNQYWKKRASSGAPRKYDNPDDLWRDCLEYFDLREGLEWNGATLPFTIGSLCIFLDITQGTWGDWRAGRKDLLPVITRVDEIIRDQKFTGAMVGVYQHNIVARDLGLADKKELTGAQGGPIETVNKGQTPAEAAAAYEATLKGEGSEG